MNPQPTLLPVAPLVNEILTLDGANVLDRASVLDALSDYILQINYHGYQPDARKVLAVRISDRTAILRNAGTPIRHEVYYFIEEEIFSVAGTTRLQEGQRPRELAEILFAQQYEQLCTWTAYDFIKGSLAGFKRPFDHPVIVEGSSNPNPEQTTRNRSILPGVNPAFFQPDPAPATVIAPGFVPDIATDSVRDFVTKLVSSDFRNALPEEDNSPIFAAPVLGIASAHDPLFQRFQDGEVVGPVHRLPREWLPGAESIISVFLPFSEHIAQAYQKDTRYSAIEFSSGKWNGSKFLNVVRRALIRFVECQGGQGVAPNIDPRYYTEGWTPYYSERHAAFAAGVGTFGLHQGLITEKGVLGRICSIITTLKLTPTSRPYTDVYGYCLYAFNGQCRACIDRCPVAAISDVGKSTDVCYTNGNRDHYHEWGYNACGHCSTFVPCARGIPAPIRKALGH
jgi:ferredoxin